MNNFATFLRAIPFSTRGRKTTRKSVYKAFHKEFGLELDECLHFLCVEPSDVPEAEMAIAKKVWRRGRSAAIHTAADKLFSSMEMRGGGAIALDYLRQLSSTFKLEAAPASGGSGSGFVFNVIMPEEEPDVQA